MLRPLIDEYSILNMLFYVFVHVCVNCKLICSLKKLNPDSVTEQKFRIYKNMNQHKSILNKFRIFQVDFEQPYQTGQVESSYLRLD